MTTLQDKKYTIASLEVGQALKARYRSWLYAGFIPTKEDIFPDHLFVSAALEGGRLAVRIKHGRFGDVVEPMEGIGFEGPTFYCRVVELENSVLRLGGVDEVGIELANQLKMDVSMENIKLIYADHDLLEIPNFRDGAPAYFGEFTITAV